VVALTVPGVAAAALAPGDLDPSFGSGGVAIVDPSLAAPRASDAGSLAVDAQGRVLVGGAASDENGKIAAWAGRLQPNGSIDSSFADGWRGVFQLGIGGTGAFRPYSMTSDVLALGDGKVGIVPYRIINESNSGAPFLRLRDNGQRDPDHGTNGLGGPAVPAAPAEMNANAGLGNPDGGALLGGSYDPDAAAAGGRELAWWKLDAFGTPVNIPGEGLRGGLQPSQAPSAAGQYSSVVEMVRLASGKTLLVGSTSWSDTRGAGFVARLNATGEVDPTFGTTAAGYTVVQARDPSGPGGGDSSFSSIAVAPDGNIYAGGTADDGAGQQAFAVVRLGPGGVVDPTFGSQGIRRVQLAGGTSDMRRSTSQSVVVQPDGKPVLVGSVDDGDGSGRTAAVIRLTTGGALDTSFGSGGIRRVPVPAGFARLGDGDAVIAPAGRLTFGGSAVNAGGGTAAVVRMTLEPVADPPPPPSGGGPAPAAPAPAIPFAPDRVKPRITGLRVTFDRKRVPLVRFTASEAARVTVLVERVRKGRRRSGRCVVGARRGARCTSLSRIRSSTRSLTSGAQTFRGAASALVASATYRVTVTATDAAGNRSAPVKVEAKVPRPKRKRR
jgi:uncharacterized delta-60 repeat protein